MKNYVIVALAVVILVLASLMYKNSKTSTPPFPIHEEAKTRGKNVEVPLYIYVYFKKNNCHDCLDVMDVLNTLPPQFVVTGIVPEEELKNEKELRAFTGAAFPLEGLEKYRKHRPWYTPTLIGVSPTGNILFTTPGVPGETAYLATFLDAVYGRMYPIFLEEKLAR